LKKKLLFGGQVLISHLDLISSTKAILISL
jgi:hypothetical protein